MPVPKPVVLCILDGWGIGPDPANQRPGAGACPHLQPPLGQLPAFHPDNLCPDVGLPRGQMGNSEVGHTNIGAGRVVAMDLGQIDLAIEEGTFAREPALRDFIAALKASGGAAHLAGLVSPGGVHAHQAHMARGRADHRSGAFGAGPCHHRWPRCAAQSGSEQVAALEAALPPGARIVT